MMVMVKVWWGWWWWKQIKLKELLVEFKVTNNSDEDKFYSLSQYNDNVYKNINNKEKWRWWRERLTHNNDDKEAKLNRESIRARGGRVWMEWLMKIPALLLEMGKVDPKKSQKENETNVTESLIISFSFQTQCKCQQKRSPNKKIWKYHQWKWKKVEWMKIRA